MFVRVTCRACGKRLKLPEGVSPRRSAKCPKCLSPVDLTAAAEASVYMSAVTVPSKNTAAEKDTVKAPPPLPGPGRGTFAPTKPTALPRVPGSFVPPAPPRKEPPNQEPLTLDEEAPLSLDDDPAAAAPPAEVPPFRVPVTVLADSARQILGPCFAVFVPHGLFLEVEPLKPFFYVPVGCPADSPGPADLTVALPDGRAVTLRVRARYGRALARDAVPFLGGERPAPVAAEYRRKWWLLAVALVLAAGLVSGPLSLARTANLDAEFATKLAGAFALAGFAFNAAVVVFSRRSTFGQFATMALACALVTGVFLFGAGAYLTGRAKGREEARAEFPPPAPPADTPRGPPAENPPPGPPTPSDPGVPRPPSHLDKAAADGVSALEDGPAEVTALDLAANGNHLAIGHADGSTRVWAMEQPTFDLMLPGPKLDGPVTRVQFDASCRLMFAYSSTGVVAVPRGGVPPAPVKLNGLPVAIAPELANERLRFAAVRGNQVAQRLLGVNFVLSPPAKAKGFAVPTPKDEVTPAGVAADPPKPAGPTFLAWSHGNRLYAGSPDGAVTVWSAAMKAEPANRDHKAPVKAWASSFATWDFATGDDKGAVAVWPAKGGKPVLAPVFSAPVAALSFAPSGQWLAVTDATGWLAICDATTLNVLRRKKLPSGAKALAFGPTDDVLILANGKTVEVWSLPALLK